MASKSSSRGRPNKSASKTTAKPSTASKLAGIASSGVAVAQSLGLIGGKKSKGSKGFGHKKTAKQMLRKAYDRRAKHQIRCGNLGQARRTLRKKATIV